MIYNQHEQLKIRTNAKRKYTRNKLLNFSVYYTRECLFQNFNVQSKWVLYMRAFIYERVL